MTVLPIIWIWIQMGMVVRMPLKLEAQLLPRVLRFFQRVQMAIAMDYYTITRMGPQER